MEKKKLFLFDLDGVLINSKSNMKFSWKAVNEKHQLNIGFKKYFSYIGRDFKDILKNLGIKKNFKEIEKTFKTNSKKKISKIKLYPFSKFLINYLKKKKIKVGIVTSKDCTRTRILLKKLSLKFDIVKCTDGYLPGKPNPIKIINILKKYKLKKKDTVLIGDMKIDVKMAKNAKIDYIHANYGYYNNYINCKYKINNLKDIINNKLGI